MRRINYIFFILLLFITHVIAQTNPEKRELIKQNGVRQVKETYYYLFRGTDSIKDSWTEEEYDKRGNLISTILKTSDGLLEDMMNSKTTYEYDSLGNVTREVKKSKQETTEYKHVYVYNNQKQVIKNTYSYILNKRHMYDIIYESQYDMTGNKILEIQKTESGKIDQVYKYRYNSLNRKVECLWFSGCEYTDTLSKTYFNYNSENCLTEKINKSNDGRVSKETYIYNSKHQLIKKDSETEIYNYKYNEKGLETEMKKVAEFKAHNFRRVTAYSYY